MGKEFSDHFRRVILSNKAIRGHKLHGPPMLVDKTNLGSVIYNHANFYRFEKTSSYWSVTRRSGFL